MPYCQRSSTKWLRVDGRFLSNLRSADDIVLFSRNTTEAETMLRELNEVGKRRTVN
ncbi:unnamed protein product [Strongylus vulgaris]|uniref:Reverse transcriptase domain-containing protein n=1 Tax=Strongylus vulgaris TaxID=40348 RepID=A0A3P7IXP6_STRVU|nr:unnamed protein product [Strongylus vulgaris]